MTVETIYQIVFQLFKKTFAQLSLLNIIKHFLSINAW